MKGQKRESKRETERKYIRRSLEGLAAVTEETNLEDDGDQNVQTPQGSFNENDAKADVSTEMATRKPTLMPKETSPDFGSPGRMKTFVRMGSNSAPATPLHFGKRFDENEEKDSPIILGQSESGGVSFNEKCAVFEMPDLDLTPPQTPGM